MGTVQVSIGKLQTPCQAGNRLCCCCTICELQEKETGQRRRRRFAKSLTRRPSNASSTAGKAVSKARSAGPAHVKLLLALEDEQVDGLQHRQAKLNISTLKQHTSRSAMSGRAHGCAPAGRAQTSYRESASLSPSAAPSRWSTRPACTLTAPRAACGRPAAVRPMSGR